MGDCNSLLRRPRAMKNVGTQNRSMWALAFTAAAGLGMIFAGRALARPRIAPHSVPSVLSFNPFNPVRTTVSDPAQTGFVGPLAAPSSTPSSTFVGPLPAPVPFVGPVPAPTSGITGGSTDSWGPPSPPPGRRPPIRDPFRPPTRSPVAPLIGMDGNLAN